MGIKDMSEEESTISAIAKLRETMVEAEAGNSKTGLQFNWRNAILELVINVSDADCRRIAEACRTSMLLISAAEDGTLLAEDESRVQATCDDSGASFVIFDENGAPLVMGENWDDLVARLPREFPQD